MAEGSPGSPMCTGVCSRQDPVPSTRGWNFPEYQLPELNTHTFYVGIFRGLWRGWLCGHGDLWRKKPLTPVLPRRGR